MTTRFGGPIKLRAGMILWEPRDRCIPLSGHVWTVKSVGTKSARLIRADRLNSVDIEKTVRYIFLPDDWRVLDPDLIWRNENVGVMAPL